MFPQSENNFLSSRPQDDPRTPYPTIFCLLGPLIQLPPLLPPPQPMDRTTEMFQTVTSAATAFPTLEHCFQLLNLETLLICLFVANSTATIRHITISKICPLSLFRIWYLRFSQVQFFPLNSYFHSDLSESSVKFQFNENLGTLLNSTPLLEV